jgi:hypothetical protein
VSRDRARTVRPMVAGQEAKDAGARALPERAGGPHLAGMAMDQRRRHPVRTWGWRRKPVAIGSRVGWARPDVPLAASRQPGFGVPSAPVGWPGRGPPALPPVGTGLPWPVAPEVVAPTCRAPRCLALACRAKKPLTARPSRWAGARHGRRRRVVAGYSRCVPGTRGARSTAAAKPAREPLQRGDAQPAGMSAHPQQGREGR